MSSTGTSAAGGDAASARGGDLDAAETAVGRVAFVAGLAEGGIAAHVATLAAGCRAAGVAVSVAAPGTTIAILAKTFAAPAIQRLRDSDEQVAFVPLRIGRRPSPARDLRAIAALRGWIASWRPDVVHAHGVRAGAVAVAAVALTAPGARPALVVTVHNAPPAGRTAAVIHGVLEHICARRADLVLCASADLLARIRAHGPAASRQFDVPAATGPAAAPAPADAAAVRRELGAASRPVVLAVGRLAPQKGLDILLAAAGRWRHRDPRPVTVIVGGGPLASQLAAQASRLDGDVRLLGPRDDVPALLAAADVVVVPSRWEARALIVQEAMRAGRPVVASRVGGIPDLAGEDGALLVPPGDPAALAAAVTAVLDDPVLAARLGDAASARASSFPDVNDALREALAIYANLAPRRSSGR